MLHWRCFGHSEHRYPAPSSKFRASLSSIFLQNHFPALSSKLQTFRSGILLHLKLNASLSGTFLQTQRIAFRHFPPNSTHRFPALSSKLNASLSGAFLSNPRIVASLSGICLQTQSITFRHLPSNSSHRFPALPIRSVGGRRMSSTKASTETCS